MVKVSSLKVQELRGALVIYFWSLVGRSLLIQDRESDLWLKFFGLFWCHIRQTEDWFVVEFELVREFGSVVVMRRWGCCLWWREGRVLLLGVATGVMVFWSGFGVSSGQ